MGNVELFEFCETVPKVQSMLRMPSLLESRNSLSHLWTSLERKWIKPKFSPMATGCFLNPELRHQKGATSWCSARQNWGTEGAFRGPPCAEEMSQKEISRNSRSLPMRFNISWFATKNWLDWGEVHRDGQVAQENHSYCPSSEEFERYKKNWYITLNKSGRNAPMKLRSDFREALIDMHRLHRESWEERPEPIPFHQYQRWHSSSSSSSTSWWQWNEYWWSS